MKNIHQLYNLSITIIVVMFSILLSSCSPSYGLGPISPGIYTSNSQFENDKWLILGTHLINKYDNTESKLLLKDGKANEEMAAKSMRVIAVAFKSLSEEPVNPTSEELENDLTFACLIGLIDPPRDGVETAIELCKKAGIKRYRLNLC